MKKQDALDRLGGVVGVARALGLKPQAISQWGETIPPLRAYQLERLTGGELKADEALLGKRPAVRVAPGTKLEDIPCVKRAIAQANAAASAEKA